MRLLWISFVLWTRVRWLALSGAEPTLAPTGQQLLLDLLCNARCQTKGGEKTRIAAAIGLGCMDEDSPLFVHVRVL